MYLILVNAGFESVEEKERVLGELKSSFDHEVTGEKDTWFDMVLFAEKTKEDLVEKVNDYFEPEKVTEGWVDVYLHMRSGSIHKEQ